MRSMGEFTNVRAYLKKKKKRKGQPTMETSPDRGLGVKSVSNRQGGPQPRTQALDLQLIPNRTHPGEGLLALSIWSLEGQVQSCGLLSHSWLQIRGLPQWPHHHRFSPKPPFGVFPSHQQGLGHDRGWCSPASFWRKGYVPSRRG